MMIITQAMAAGTLMAQPTELGCEESRGTMMTTTDMAGMATVATWVALATATTGAMMATEDSVGGTTGEVMPTTTKDMVPGETTSTEAIGIDLTTTTAIGTEGTLTRLTITTKATGIDLIITMATDAEAALAT